MIFKLLGLMKKKIIISILIAMVLGILVGYNFDVEWMKQTITPLTFLMVYPMLVTLKLESLKEKGNFKLQLVTMVINFGVLPFVAYLLGVIFFEDVIAFRLGLIMMSLLPTSGMTISWTVMGKGNVSEAIRMVVFGLLVGSILSPLYIKLFLGESIDVSIWFIFSKIAIIVFVPLLFAFLTQVVLKKQYGEEKFHKQIKPKFPLFSILAVVLMIFAAMALKAKVLVDKPEYLLDVLVPIILFYIVTFGIQLVLGKFLFNKKEAIALSNGTMVRNLSIALSIVLGAFEGLGLAALLIAIAYVVQVQFAAWNTRLADTFYKEKTTN